MARSSLFAMLVRMARTHGEAKRRGVAVATVEEERAAAHRSGVSRRTFLGAAGAAAATFALLRTARAGTNVNPRVVVVGAGISGLSAALALTDAKLTSNLTIYEASNRIGGRMFSNTKAIGGTSYWDNDQVTEWCGELIDSGHTTMQMLAKRYNLPLDDLPPSAPAGSTPVYLFGGKYYTFDQVNTDFAPVYQKIEDDAAAAIPMMTSDGKPNDDMTVLWNAITDAGKALDSMSVHDWIEAKVPGGHTSNLGKLLDMAYASEYGADTTDQSALNLVLLLSGLPMAMPFGAFGASDERFHTRGGNQQIPLAIAADLTTKLGASAIQMNSRLTKIVKNADNTTTLSFDVTNAGMTTSMTVIADAVILTVPFAVMADKVDYTMAGFDARKTMAITQLGRGLCSKLQLQFTSRLWNTKGAWGISNGEESFSDNGDQCSWDATRGQPGTSGILNGYTGGTPTMMRAAIAPINFGKVNMGTAGAGIATLAGTFAGQLDQIFPGVKALYNMKATLSIPHLDDNMRLSYAFWKVGQYQAFAGYERTPQGNIFFGGEHTSVNAQGFMEGGAAEGQRAAQEVIDAAMAGTLPMMSSMDMGTTMPPAMASGCSCEVGASRDKSSSRSGALLPMAAALVGGLAARKRRVAEEERPKEDDLE